MHETTALMPLVLSRNPLPAYYHDHAVTVCMPGFRELHIGGDYLLVYRTDKDKNVVVFTDIGTHAELFDEYCSLISGHR